jgi:hypothetical protein
MKIVWGRSIGFNIDLHKARMSYNGANKFNPSPGKVYMEYSIITDGADCHPWHEVFVWWPVKTINGKRLWWCKAFKRKVWVVWGTGFHMEPEIQYATAFDMITDPWQGLTN